jgi:hypothetical protein
MQCDTKYAAALCCVSTRFNRLSGVMKSSLAELQKALKGLVVMSAELEGVYNCMLANQVCVCVGGCSWLWCDLVGRRAMYASIGSPIPKPYTPTHTHN